LTYVDRLAYVWSSIAYGKEPIPAINTQKVKQQLQWLQQHGPHNKLSTPSSTEKSINPNKPNSNTETSPIFA
jgi:hypothetical protein